MRQKQSAENNHLAKVGACIFVATRRVTANPYVRLHPRARMNPRDGQYARADRDELVAVPDQQRGGVGEEEIGDR